MLSCLKLTRSDTGGDLFIPADLIRRIEPKGEGALVFAPDAGGTFQVTQSAKEIVVGINQAIGWKETRVVQGQIDAQQQLSQQQSGLLVPHNPNGRLS